MVLNSIPTRRNVFFLNYVNFPTLVEILCSKIEGKVGKEVSYSRIGKGNLVLRYSVPHFSPAFCDIMC